MTRGKCCASTWPTRMTPYEITASASGNVKRWESSRWRNRFDRSWWTNRTIRLTWPPRWEKKFRMSEREEAHAASKIRVEGGGRTPSPAAFEIGDDFGQAWEVKVKSVGQECPTHTNWTRRTGHRHCATRRSSAPIAGGLRTCRKEILLRTDKHCGYGLFRELARVRQCGDPFFFLMIRRPP